MVPERIEDFKQVLCDKRLETFPRMRQEHRGHARELAIEDINFSQLLFPFGMICF